VTKCTGLVFFWKARISMSPTVLKEGRIASSFFSREEPRMHVHISCPDGEAKFCIEPIISLATYHQGNCMINLLKRKTGSASREDQA
jgi:hypothetical protein